MGDLADEADFFLFRQAEEQQKEAYLVKRAQELQSAIVSFKSASTATTGSYIWTYRHTSCDVVSIVTTTVPIKQGVMKDLKLHNKEMRRYIDNYNYDLKLLTFNFEIKMAE